MNPNIPVVDLSTLKDRIETDPKKLNEARLAASEMSNQDLTCLLLGTLAVLDTVVAGASRVAAAFAESIRLDLFSSEEES